MVCCLIWCLYELISDVLLWTPTHGCARVGRPARTYIQQLCEDTGCNPEDLPEAMNDREKWRETVRDIRADGATWWWWLLVYEMLIFFLFKVKYVNIDSVSNPFNMRWSTFCMDEKAFLNQFDLQILFCMVFIIIINIRTYWQHRFSWLSPIIRSCRPSL